MRIRDHAHRVSKVDLRGPAGNGLAGVTQVLVLHTQREISVRAQAMVTFFLRLRDIRRAQSSATKSAALWRSETLAGSSAPGLQRAKPRHQPERVAPHPTPPRQDPGQDPHQRRPQELAEAANIHAAACNQSPESVEFCEFVKTMETCKSALTNDTTLILSTGNEFFRFRKDMGLK